MSSNNGETAAITNLDRIREYSPEIAEHYLKLRIAIDGYTASEAKQRELILLAGFAATRNEGGLRVHCKKAVEAGATVAEVEQTILLMLGTSLGLATTVDALHWVRDELQGATK